MPGIHSFDIIYCDLKQIRSKFPLRLIIYRFEKQKVSYFGKIFIDLLTKRFAYHIDIFENKYLFMERIKSTVLGIVSTTMVGLTHSQKIEIFNRYYSTFRSFLSYSCLNNSK